ncbi:extracellular aldonolactonase [Chaetomium sp. MPI-SDFR-AT-0129]|nr:extracellular aldonolactonase [Chaetomium sp. MPI-SDFR-AT-0129]
MRTSHGVALALSAGLQLATAAPVCTRDDSGLFWVTTYPAEGAEAGSVYTLKLTDSKLEQVAESDACGPYPSWLTQAGDVLYCVNEAWGGDHGNLTALQIGTDNSLTKLSGSETVGGPVNIAIYGKGNALAVADYAGGGVDAFDITDTKAIKLIHSEVYALPGDDLPNPQDSARPHEALLDPTGNYIVLPDLGADRLRVLKLDQTTQNFTDLAPYEFERGTGPRHGAFYVVGDVIYFYVVCELSNLLQGFKVTYQDEGLKFDRFWNSTSHGDQEPLPTNITAAAELHIAPNSNFLTLSSRYENALTYTVANGTEVPSDPLITFSIDNATGELSLVQIAPAGGANPRHFSFNADGSRVASALQNDGRVVIFERDITTGKIGKVVAEADVAGSPNFIGFKQ